MVKVELRNNRLSDAKRFYEILNSPNFVFFSAKPKSIEAEREWLKKSKEDRKNNFEHNYTILYGGELVGGCGIKIDQHRKHVGELGYFIDEDYWGKGIATKAVRLLEKIGFKELGLERLVVLMDPKNKASERVAVKRGYKKEGTMRKAVKVEGEFKDMHLYAKVK